MKETENKTATTMRAGFTLMEILVAVAIIGILGTVAVMNIAPALDDAKVTAAESSVKSIRGAIETYSFRHGGKYPKDLKDLVVEKNGKAPAIEGGEDVLLDPWGTEYKYEKKGRAIAVVSAGPDMTFGNEDDIRSDKVRKAEKE